MSIVKIVGIILIFLALYSFMETMSIHSDGERALYAMRLSTDAGFYGQSYHSVAEDSMKFVETTSEYSYHLGLVTTFVIGLIGISFITIDKKIEQLLNGGIQT